MENIAAPSPRRVILFSGHMIDHPESARRRFPQSMAPAAAHAVAAALEEWQAGPSDLAICGGACGGDLLFAEAALQRQVPVELYLALPAPEFCRESVSFAGGDWQQRFECVLNGANVTTYTLPTAEDSPASVWERSNDAMGAAALRWGSNRVRLLCLWDGQTGYGPGGTAHMVSWANDHGIPVRQIRPQDLTPDRA